MQDNMIHFRAMKNYKSQFHLKNIYQIIIIISLILITLLK